MVWTILSVSWQYIYNIPEGFPRDKLSPSLNMGLYFSVHNIVNMDIYATLSNNI